MLKDGQATLSGPVAIKDERLTAVARNSLEMCGEQREK